MSGQQYSVEITVGVLEKLAGRKPKKQAPQAPIKPQGKGAPQPHPDIVALSKEDVQLSKALQSSRRVGGLLLKREEEELVKVKQLTKELLEKHSFPIKPVPCEAERRATLACYQDNQQDPLRCAAQVQAYSSCSGRAFNDYVKGVSTAAKAS